MSNVQTLLDRNRAFAIDFAAADLPITPKLGAIVLTCIDPRVDPAHFMGLELGDAGVIRNVGARVTPAVIQELAMLSFLAGQLTGADTVPMELVIIQHSDCGAERLANPQVQQALQKNVGIDMSHAAISDHEASLREDLERLRNAKQIPKNLVVSAFIYDVHTGRVREVIPPAALSAIPSESKVKS